MARRSCGVEGGGVSFGESVALASFTYFGIVMTWATACLWQMSVDVKRFVDACDRNEREARGE